MNNKRIHIPPFLEDEAIEKRRREIIRFNRLLGIAGIVLAFIGLAVCGAVGYLVIHTWIVTGVLK